VDALAEEHPGRAMQLGYDDPFGAVDDKSTFGRHVGDIPEENILDDGLEIDVFFVVTGQAQFRLQGNAIGQSALHTFLDGIAGRIDKIVEEFEDEDVPGIRNRKVFLKHLIQAFVDPIFRSGFQLEEFLEGLQLDFEEIRIIGHEFSFAETDPLIFGRENLSVGSHLQFCLCVRAVNSFLETAKVFNGLRPRKDQGRHNPG